MLSLLKEEEILKNGTVMTCLEGTHESESAKKNKRERSFTLFVRDVSERGYIIKELVKEVYVKKSK